MWAFAAGGQNSQESAAAQAPEGGLVPRKASLKLVKRLPWVSNRKGFCSVGRQLHHVALMHLCHLTWKQPLKNFILKASAIAKHFVVYERIF